MWKFTKYAVLGGTVLINTVLCMNMFMGNVTTYIYSYHYTRSRSDSFDLDPAWIYPVYIVARCLGTSTVDFVRKRTGPKATIGLGTLIYVVPLFLSCFAVTYSVWATTLTFIMMGIGNGMASLCSIVLVSAWFGSNVGSANAVSISASAVGGFVINLMITSYVNPNNLSPDRSIGEISFFSQAEVVDRIPSAFLLIGGFSAGLGVFGFCFLRTPPEEVTHDKPCTSQGHREDNGEKELLGSANYTVTLYTPEDGCHPNQQKEHETSFGSHTISGTSEIQTHQNDDSLCHGNTCTQTDGSNNDDAITYMKPSEVLKSETFYVIICAFTAIIFGLLICVNYYKLFGQLWIHNDHFLAFLGSTLSLGSILSLVGGGALIDCIGIKNVLVIHLSISAFFMSFWYFTARFGKFLYLLWTLILYCVHNNVFLIFSVACLKLFGEPHFSINFALVQIPCVLVSLGCAPIATFILSELGWFWLFFSCACVSFLALIPAILRLRA